MRADDWLEDLDTGAFAGDYAGARERFLQAAQRAGAAVRCYPHPLAGPEGERLATDTAWLGPENATCVLVLQSAMHGVEGFCGAGAQTDFLRHAPRLPADTAVLVIHAINPHGFAWLRRVTEDGVDLNRNFVDFTVPLPENPGYDELSDAIVPADLEPATIEACDARLAAYAAAHGRTAFEVALSAGQYRQPHGMFYGGRAPCWSRLTTEAIVAGYRLAARRLLGVIDFHTGLGPFGYGEPICDHPPGSRGAGLARAWYGDALTEPALGTSSSVAKFGLSDYGWQALVGKPLVFVALEFGTFDFASMIRVMRADHHLHAAGRVDWQAERTRDIKAAIRRHFYPATADWQQAVLFRARQVIAQALAGLAQG
jgi:Protein of unknown function (DUF2817)